MMLAGSKLNCRSRNLFLSNAPNHTTKTINEKVNTPEKLSSIALSLNRNTYYSNNPYKIAT